MRNVAFGILVAAALAAIAMNASGQAQLSRGSFPACQPVRIASPDGRWTLNFNSIGCYCPEAKSSTECFGVKLGLEQQGTHQVRQIDLDGYGGSAEWSPDSSAFIVNVSVVSNESDAFLFQVNPFRKVDLRSVIQQNDRTAKKWMDDHSYVVARKWLNKATVQVQLCGHTDETPAVQFDVLYRVSLNGRTEKITEKHGPPDDAECSMSNGH